MALDKKLVIVVRKDLDMKMGKKIVLIIHATVRAVKKASRMNMFLWETFNNENKIILEVNSLDDLWDIRQKCRDEKINYVRARDLSGEIPSEWAAIAIGPHSSKEIDKINHETVH